MNLADLLTLIEPPQALAIVLGASIVLYTLTANLAWGTHQTHTGRWGRIFTWLRRAWIARTAKEVIRWLYYLALPWVTLMLGFNTVRSLGVWGVDWLGRAAQLGVLGLGAVIVIVWVWRPYARSEHPHAIDESGWNWARHIVELIYQEAHWAFYRSGPILWLGDFYWASFLGLALALIEGWSNPAVRANARDVTRADAPLWSSSLAIVSTIVFIFTQNTWYCLIVHLFIDLGLRRTIGFPRAHTPGDSALID